MTGTTRDSILSWLAIKPQTLEWDAIVAYDRNKTNTVLMQEYISRFSTDSFMEPYNEDIPTGDDTREVLYDYTFDRPRLSFVNAYIKDSMARLTLKVIGGSQIRIQTLPGGMPQVTKMWAVDALDGPELSMDIELKRAEGLVDSAGVVYLDLAEGVKDSYRLSFANTDAERKKGGDYFKARFLELEDIITKFELNNLGSNEGHYLQPINFYIRTHAAPGSKLRGAANAGDGAVLMFIVMDGGETHGIPVKDEDWQYLIPEDGNHSCTVLLGNRYLMKKIISEGCKSISTSDDFDFHIDYLGAGETGFVDKLTVTNGLREIKEVALENPSTHFKSLSIAPFKLPMGKSTALPTAYADPEPDPIVMGFTATPEVLEKADKTKERTGKLIVEWRGTQDQPVSLTTNNNTLYKKSIGSTWLWEKKYEFILEGQPAALKMKETSDAGKEYYLVRPGQFATVEEVAQYFDEISNSVDPQLGRVLKEAMDSFVKASEEIDIFRLNSLLFRGDDTVHLNSVHFPGDLALFGEIAPSLTKFVISPLEYRMGPGGTYTFATTPSQTGLQWSVDFIKGDDDTEDPKKGTIDANGKYTAPSSTLIEGLYKRVRVTATSADGKYSSSALVTIVTRDIAINPLVQVGGATLPGQSPRKLELSAGSLEEAPLVWSIKDPKSGSSVVPSTEEGGDHTYIPGAADGNGKAITIDEIIVENTKTKNKQSSFVVLVHNAQLSSVRINEAESSQTSIKLELLSNGKPLPPENITFSWELLAGSGSIEKASGVFTPNPDGAHKFAVVYVSALLELYGIYVYGYMILPIPLIDLTRTSKLLSHSVNQ